ncbi:interferon-gamma-inducible GTPase 10-like [Sardina pilchardus]|uniref:interferon-gamma-inducible GTPase 10-like n=1 Tax=Sardina pilchardus TaxID=27697 RepID=UPI002E0EA3B4
MSHYDGTECDSNSDSDSDIGKHFAIEHPEEVKGMFKDFTQSPDKIREKIESLEHVTLNIAITGNSGAGKSTFVNAILGLSNDDEGAAETGATETTRKPKAFTHPTMPNVTIWDLPGVGTQNFRAKTYLKDVKFKRYDFFIIISSERFKENDIKLAKAVKKKKKLFYFIRSKIDNDVNAESKKKGFNKEDLLSKIREDCKMNLKGVGKPQVFLISSFNLQSYDFNRLMDTLEKELPENKKHALIQALPIYSLEALERKKKIFHGMVWLTALASGVASAVPVPGLTMACDYGIVTGFLDVAFKCFGLEDKSLKMLASRVRMNWKDLKGEIKSRFKDGVTPGVVMSFFKTPSMVGLMTVKSLLSCIVFFGAAPAGAISVAVMHFMLNKALKEMEKDAKAVLEKAQL